MRLLSHVSSALMALAMVVCLVSPVTSQPTSSGTVSVQVVPAVGEGDGLSSVVTTVELHPIPQAQVDAGPSVGVLPETSVFGGIITIMYSDLRGDASGWTITLAGTDFISPGNTNRSFSITNLSLGSGVVVATQPNASPTSVSPVSLPLNPVANQAQPALIAAPGSGAGNYISQRQALLTIPEGTSAGDYRSTLTITITGTAP